MTLTADLESRVEDITAFDPVPKDGSVSNPTREPVQPVQQFLHELATVAGYVRAPADRRDHSNYVQSKPLLTLPNPWFFAGMVALEAAAICSLFPPRDASQLMRQIANQVDAVVGREGRDVANVIFALIGRLGYGAVLLRARVPMRDVAKVILLMLGGPKVWRHLLPDEEAHRQIRAALNTGAPTWWRDFLYTGRWQRSLTS